MRTPEHRAENNPAASPAPRPLSAALLFVAGALAAAILALIVLASLRWIHATGGGGLVPTAGLPSALWALVLVSLFPIAAAELSRISDRPAYQGGLLLGRAAGVVVLVWWLLTDGPIGDLLRALAEPYARLYVRLGAPDLATTAAMLLMLMASGAGIGFMWTVFKGDARGAAFFAAVGVVFVALLVLLLMLAG